MRQPIHAHGCQHEMAEAEIIQRPRQRQQQVYQGKWIANRSVPLGEEWNAAKIKWIPKRDLAAPKTLFGISGIGISEEAEITVEKGIQAEHDPWISEEKE